MLKIIETENLEKIYNYQIKFNAPFFISKDFSLWRKSFEEDVDGEGRVLFKEIFVKVAWEENEIVGFIQYGKTAFGFDNQGEISLDISYQVIRNLYFDENRADIGELLLKDALNEFETSNKIYAFFHYFGMSCFARHGKLFEKYDHIEDVLKKNGFET